MSSVQRALVLLKKDMCVDGRMDGIGTNIFCREDERVLKSKFPLITIISILYSHQFIMS